MPYLRRLSPVFWGSFLTAFVALVFKCSQHLGVRSHACDLIFSDQAIWNFVQGKGLYVSLFHVQTFGDHFYPYFLLLAPFYWLYATPFWVFFALSLCFGFTAYPILRLAYDHFGKKWMWGMAAFLIAYYPLRAGFIQDFHGELVLMPLISWAVYFIVKEKWGKALWVSLALLLAKESAIVFIVPICVYVFWKSSYKKEAMLTLIVSLMATFWIMGVFMPSFHSVDAYSHWDKYSELGHSPIDIIKTAVTQPGIILGKIFSGRTLGSVAGMMVPFAFLPFFSPLLWIGFGLFLQNFLTDSNILMSRIHDHCMLPFIPILFIAFIEVVSRFKTKKWIVGWAAFCVVLNVLIFVFTEMRIFINVPQRYAAMQVIKAKIPADATLAGSDQVLPHFHYRDRLFVHQDFKKADYVVLEGLNEYFPRDVNAEAFIKNEWNTGSKSKAIMALIMGEERPYKKEDPYVQLFDAVHKDPSFTLVYKGANLVLFKRN
jgi:uncharacterized membrane protein